MRWNLKDGVYWKKEKESAKLRMGGGSWTINLEEIDTKTCDGFGVITESTRYEIDKDTAMSKGWMMTLGGERKLIVPLKNWKTR